MSKAIYITPNEKKRNNSKIFYGLFVSLVVVAGGLFVREYTVIKNIQEITMRIDEIENEKLFLEEEIKLLQEAEERLKKESELLEDTLWVYRPVIVPDSMK